VFFFALFAGWLRERTGSIAAPVVYHAVANVWYAIVFSSLS
jgi:membrane protease YdiL (CAAX protease family)